MKIVFFGNTKYSRLVAEIINKAFPISQIVTIPDRKVGRDRTLTENPVKQFAHEENIPVITTDEFQEKIIQEIAKVKPDFLVVSDYGLILPKNLLKLPKYAALNVHHSLLPKYRGPSPAPTTILNGDKFSGVTIIEMSEEVDAGDIVSQKEYQLVDDETTDSLLSKLNQIGGELLLAVIPQYLEGTVKPIPQDYSQASYTKQLTKEGGYFQINNLPSPEKLDRMIRAYFPWPTAWTLWEAKSQKPKAKRIVKFLPGGLVQMEGKKPVLLKDFLNGYPDFPIKKL